MSNTRPIVSWHLLATFLSLAKSPLILPRATLSKAVVPRILKHLLDDVRWALRDSRYQKADRPGPERVVLRPGHHPHQLPREAKA